MVSYVHHSFTGHSFWTQSWYMCFYKNTGMHRYQGRGFLTLRLSHKYGNVSITFPVLLRKVPASKQRLRNFSFLLVHLKSLLTSWTISQLFAKCHPWGILMSFLITLLWLHYWWHSAIILYRVVKSVATFLFSFSTCSQLCFFFLKGLGEMNPAILLFIKDYGQEWIYQKCEVGVGGRSN